MLKGHFKEYHRMIKLGQIGVLETIVQSTLAIPSKTAQKE